MQSPIFKANVIIRGKIECLSGMHIGGSKDKMEIGGVDSPVLRNPRTRMPYIPGSSLKGKMRYLIEFSKGVVNMNGDVSKDSEIGRLFGIHAEDKVNNDIGPSRLIFRDCNPDEETIEMWKNMDSELLYTEFKPENTIDRLTASSNPRFVERVVSGSKFDFEIIYGVYQMNETEGKELIQRDLDNLLEALRILEHSALGNSASRGYGKIRFELAEPIIVTIDDYKNNTANYQKANLKLNDKELKALSEIKIEYK